ncbi:MAG: glycosyltransferase family 39 protein [Bacteroidetes bacterium]|nr:glycosyltransferase family 39 protein [Bacteroidota bacterium]
MSETTYIKIQRSSRVLIISLFAVYFIVGLFTFSDYGLSWDENSQWKNNGHANYNFIFHDDERTLLDGLDKYHGPAFELVLVFIENAFSMQELRSIFLMRHLFTFLTFFISAIVFFFLSRKIFKKDLLALLGVLMYVLSPHIYSHSFYNSKDAIFLAFIVFSLYSMLIFMEKPGIKSAFIYALLSAFTIDIRIIGILLPLLTISLFVVDLFLNSEYAKQGAKAFMSYFIFLIPLIILFWPVLWIDPVFHFIEALKENAKYPWNGDVLYFGEYIKAAELPWHYLFVWNFIARPILYSFLFIVGTGVLLISFVKAPIAFIMDRRIEFIIAAVFLLPLLAVLLFNSPAFDTGRHFYFMHCSFILIALYGTAYLLERIRVKNILLLVYSFFFLSFISVIIRMIQLHPYQHLYFNSAIVGGLKQAQANFETDYWGLAARPLLEQIVKNDTSASIQLFAENYPGKLNAAMLSLEDRKRIVYVDTPEVAKYYLGDYRWKKITDYRYQRELCSIELQGEKIASAFLVRSPEELYSAKGKRLFFHKNDCERPDSLWTNNYIVEGSDSLKDNRCMLLTNGVEYSDQLVIDKLGAEAGKKGLVLKLKFKYRTEENNNDLKWVVTSGLDLDKPYQWISVYHIYGAAQPSWKEVSCGVELAPNNIDNNKIKLYLWNINKKKIFIDDIEVELIEEHKE